ncbi:MAG: sigma-70 family RNA polymerase sigma factor [Actinomycetota bacterium]
MSESHGGTVETDERQAFTRFVKETEPRLSYALAAAYGFETGAEATADALAWAWEHWESLQKKRNPAGYLYRVGQSKARRYHRSQMFFPLVPVPEAPSVEPGLIPALASLTQNQRVAVVMIHGMGYSEREVADLLGLSRWSVRTHAERGMRRLRNALGVTTDATR